MIGAGIGVAAFIVLAVTIARHEADHTGGRVPTSTPPDLERLAASILYQLLLLGGTRPDDALREIRRRAGLMAPVTNGIDVANWGERFAQIAAPQQRSWLLDMAV